MAINVSTGVPIENVTPYMHAFVAHVPEFIRIHGAIVPYTQQGVGEAE